MQTPSKAPVNTEYIHSSCVDHEMLHTRSYAKCCPRRHRPISDLTPHLSRTRLPDWWHPSVVSSRTTRTGAVRVIQRTSLRVSGWLVGTRQLSTSIRMGAQPIYGAAPMRALLHTQSPSPISELRSPQRPKHKHANEDGYYGVRANYIYSLTLTRGNKLWPWEHSRDRCICDGDKIIQNIGILTARRLVKNY